MRRLLIAAVLPLTTLCATLALVGQEQSPRPPITGIRHVRFWSADTHKGLDFYSKTLGLTPREAGCVGLIRPCYIITNHQQVAMEAVPAGPHSALAEIAFATSDAPGMRSYLMAHHIDVSPIVRDFNGAIHFSLVGPEGNPIVFVQPGPLVERQNAMPAAQTSTHLIHAGFVVRDRAATDHFYKDILGFRPYWHGGMNDDKDDWVGMQVPDGTDWVEYMLNISPTADKHALGVMNHIALGVTDIQAAKAQLIKNGWKPGEEPKIGRDGKWQLNVYDPDDTRIEFMEFTPKEKPCCSEFTGPHPKP